MTEFNKILKISLISIILVQIVSCSPQPSILAELAPRSLKAVDLEETLSRHDEVMMAYSLTSYDASNKAISVVNGGWGVVSIQKGEQLDLQKASSIKAQPIHLELPRNGRIVASLVLIEVDDYNRAKQMLDKVRRIHNIVSGPAALVVTATEVLTPLKYVAAGLAASGIGLQLIDHLDDDDLLGQSSIELNEAELRKRKQRLVHVPAVFSGRNMRDSFEYRLDYDVVLKAMKIRPVRQ
ncbi:hypothetical protein WBJ53_13190 [Spirosoma sp. SC4-14]|uniref:hypothetical protein n=1 Tax=Spirosoma sp. SC4-14 TaxID=3128900 RepID=UPI0030D20D1B